MSRRVLLVQVRDAGDPMARHERQCIAQRIGLRALELRVVNALTETARADWLEEADAVVIGGSGRYSVHHPQSRPWVEPLRGLLDAVLSRSLPCFGICFGHQLLGYHLGAGVRTDEEHAEIGTVRVTLTEAGRTDPLFSELDPDLRVHTGHTDHVERVPAGVDLLARNEQLETQVFRVRGALFYTTQFHPDLTGAEAVARYVAYRGSDALSPEVAEAVSRFRPGADASATLLGRFFDLVF